MEVADRWHFSRVFIISIRLVVDALILICFGVRWGQSLFSQDRSYVTAFRFSFASTTPPLLPAAFQLPIVALASDSLRIAVLLSPDCSITFHLSCDFLLLIVFSFSPSRSASSRFYHRFRAISPRLLLFRTACVFHCPIITTQLSLFWN